jgi:predicted PurR-regulated permease PerM
MSWLTNARERAQARLAAARAGGAALPPFQAEQDYEVLADRVVVVGAGSTVEDRRAWDDGLPRGVRIAGAWAWRIILILVAGYLLLRLLGIVRVVVIPVAVALLLGALLAPAAAGLRRRGMNKSVAATLVLVGGLTIVFGGLGLIVQTFIAQFDDLSTRVGEGVGKIEAWLVDGPLHLSQAQLSGVWTRVRDQVSANEGALTSGALTTVTTVTEIVAGFFIVLLTLFFFLRDGDEIWRFVCRMLPRAAQIPVARAGHYSWQTLVSYVRATVLVAFVDAVGIGIGLLILRVPLALPLTALVFLGAFIPVIGATLSGGVAVLVALVAQGPLSALIVLGIVIAVQQLEGHVLQPLIMGRAVSLHPLAVILAIATGVVTAGIVGGLVAVPLLAVANTAVRYLVEHPTGEPTPGREPPGTRPADQAQAEAEQELEHASAPADPTDPPPIESSVDDDDSIATIDTERHAVPSGGDR